MSLEIVVNRIKKVTDDDIKKECFIPFFENDESYKKEFPSWIFNFQTEYKIEEYDWK